MFKKITTFLLAFVLLTTNVYAANPNSYNNGSKPGNANANKIITYINSKKAGATGNYFVIGQDTISYYKHFLDEERDYHGLPFARRVLPNTSLSAKEKQINPVNLKIMYEHNPSWYDNPVGTSGLHSNWYDIQVTWNAGKGKWELTDKSKQILFNIPTDDKRGEWTIHLKGTDDTGIPAFDKESTGSTKFYVHKPPVPRFSFTENTTHATLTDNGSFDIDFNKRKNSRKNVKNDREYAGIKEFYWSAKIGDNWVDLGSGPSVKFSKGGQKVTDYRLTVEDYDGAFASISKTSLILDKPESNFEFIVGGKTTSYAYKGNKGNETLSVNPLISWNDEAFSKPAYTTSGKQSKSWKAIRTGDVRTTSARFNPEIMKAKFNSIIQSGKIPVELTTSNKFDIVQTTRNSASVIVLKPKDLTGTKGTMSCPLCNPVASPQKPFMVGTDAIMILDLVDPSVKLEDLKVSISVPELGVPDLELNAEGNIFETVIPMKNVDSYNKALWDQFNYTFKIYSKRTGELLNNSVGKSYIHTPLNLEGRINDMSDGEIEINTDDPFTVSATTEKYAKTVTTTFPVDIVDVASGKTITAGTKIQLNPNTSHTNWTKQLMVGSDSLEEDQLVNAQFEAIAFNNRDKETDSVGISLISFRLENFRVTKVKDLRLKNYYKNPSDDPIKYVNDMALDVYSFNTKVNDPFKYLTKGYMFEFEIDSINFEGNNDTIVIQPSFYSADNDSRAGEKKGYWIDSNKKVLEIGKGGHSNYDTVILTKEDRVNTEPNKSTWSGQYFIPGTSFLTNTGSTTSNAKSRNLKTDIIVNFDIEGMQDGTPKFNYNDKQWGKEITINNGDPKSPYEIGDVIRYNGKSKNGRDNKGNLDDLKVNRTN